MYRAYFFKTNFWLSLLLILTIIKNPLFVLFNFANLEIQNYYYYLYVIFFVLIVFTSFLWKKHSKGLRKGLKLSLIMTSIVLIGCILTNAQKQLNESFGPLLFFMLIPFNLIQLLRKPFDLKLFLHISIFIHFVIGMLVSYFFNLAGLGYGADGMLASYAISLPSSCYLYWAIIGTKNVNKVIFLILAVLGLYLTFQAGSRGALIPFIFSILLGLLHKGIDFIKIILLLLILIVIYETSHYWVGFFNESRVAEAFSNGSLTRTTDRSQETWGPVIEAIFSSPLYGWGCFSDRLFTMDNQWAHNLFLEIFCDFGIPLGLWFLFFIIKNIYSFCFKRNNSTITILFLISIPQLLVSSSYLLSTYFWVFLGFLVFWSKNSKNFLYNNKQMKIE